MQFSNNSEHKIRLRTLPMDLHRFYSLIFGIEQIAEHMRGNEDFLKKHNELDFWLGQFEDFINQVELLR